MRTALLLIFLLGSGVAHCQSISCNEAATMVEKLICGNKELAEMAGIVDEFHIEKYDEDGNTLPDPVHQKWITSLRSCATASCLKRSFEKRITELTCSGRSLGTARGNGICSDFSLKDLNRRLVELENRYAQLIESTNTNVAHAKTSFATDRKVWRRYRCAHCASYGAVTGGTDGWVNAWQAQCEVEETKARIALLTRQLKAR
jgi:uncharacterized protein